MTRFKLEYVHEYVDCRGKIRRYVRRKGLPQVALPGLPGSAEFMQAYQVAITGHAPPTTSRHKAGTLAALVADFYQSAHFANLKPSSQATYRLVLSPHLERDGHRMVRDLPPEIATKIIEEIGATRPGMANLTRKVLSKVFEYAIRKGMRTTNPFRGIEAYKLGSVHTWTDDEIAAYEQRWPLGTRERLAFTVLLYTAQRVSDAVKMKRSDIKAGMIRITQQKTGTELSIKVHPALERAIKAGPANGIHLIGDSRGRPIISASLTQLIRQAAAKAGLPPHCKAHGLRKAAMRRLAEHGSTTKELAAVSGHRTLQEIERYTAKADQARLSVSAIGRLPDEE